MKNSYSISYLFTICSLSLLLVAAYSKSYSVQLEKSEQEISQVDGTWVDNGNIQNSGYYVRVNGDYLIIYLYDNKTVFEETDILFSELNEVLQAEILSGKYIDTTSDLYGFLENYSS